MKAMSKPSISITNDSYIEKKLMIFIVKDAYIATKVCRKIVYFIYQILLFSNSIVPKLKNQSRMC